MKDSRFCQFYCDRSLIEGCVLCSEDEEEHSERDEEEHSERDEEAQVSP